MTVKVASACVYIIIYLYAQVEHETAESMQTLLKLDAIKARMKAASDALRVGVVHCIVNDSIHTVTHTHRTVCYIEQTSHFLTSSWPHLNIDVGLEEREY